MTRKEKARSFQAYLDNVKAKTRKTPDDFAKLASQRGLAKHGDIVKWLNSDFALGHGHATAIAGIVLKKGVPNAAPEDKLAELFSGKKACWRTPCDKLMAQIGKLGSDVSVAAGGTYTNLLHGDKKFAILQPSSSERLDIGMLKGTSADERSESAGSWNAMVTHRVRINDPTQIDREVLTWYGPMTLPDEATWTAGCP